jgi:AraC-like DNA-binding protein
MELPMNRKIYKRSSYFATPDFEVYVDHIHYSAGQFDSSFLNKREFWKLIYVVQGAGWKVINAERYPITPGSLFLIHPEDETTILIESESLELYHVLFMPEIIRPQLDELGKNFNFFAIFSENFYRVVPPGQRSLLYVLDSNREMLHLMRSMLKEQSHSERFSRNIIALLLAELLLRVARRGIRNLKRNRPTYAISYVNHIIDECYMETIALDELADSVGLNKSYLCRLYRQREGRTILDTLLARRLDQAHRLLLNSEQSISDICRACGFNDLAYFYRQFKRRFTAAPGSLRKG